MNSSDTGGGGGAKHLAAAECMQFIIALCHRIRPLLNNANSTISEQANTHTQPLVKAFSFRSNRMSSLNYFL
jgi:hypothetical protein